MTNLAINLTLVEYIALSAVAMILGATIYFFLKSRRSLKKTLQDNKDLHSKSIKKESPVIARRSKISELEEHNSAIKHETAFSRHESIQTKKISTLDENSVQDLKNTIFQQQKMLNSYLAKVEVLENEGKAELRKQNNELEKEIDKLNEIIESKEEESESLKQQASMSQKMMTKIDEVYKEFDQLQIKINTLEKQASRASHLEIELEDTRQSYEQLHKDLVRKQERLEETMSENQRMRQELDQLEDKLAEANLQRQQLQKKVQFLQELNEDMQSVSEANKKLQTELRRIGELESMLTMMAEERDYLLRKKTDK